MRVRFLAAAREELRESSRFYEGQLAGLGKAFREEVRAGIERVRAHPEAWQPLNEQSRRYLLHRFPYGIVYQVRDEEILIVAIAHLHREPDYWVARVKLP